MQTNLLQDDIPQITSIAETYFVFDQNDEIIWRKNMIKNSTMAGKYQNMKTMLT